MSIPINLTHEEFLGAGNLNEYTFDFKITSLDQLLVVVLDDAGLEVQRVTGEDATYIDSVEFDSVEGGGTVTLIDNLETDYRIFLFLAADDPVQTSRFKDKGRFSLESFEQAYDILTCFIQRAMFYAKRSIKLYDTDSLDDFDPTLPIGLSANTENKIPVVTDGGFAALSLWPTLTDLEAALDAAAAAQAAQAAAEDAAAAALAAQGVAEDALAAALDAQAAAEAAAAAADGTPEITGTYAAPSQVTTQIAFVGVKYHNTWFVEGSGADQTLSANPRIAAGTSVGQKLKVIVPHTATYKVTIPDGNGVVQNGPCVLEPGASIDYEFVGAQGWFEVGRNS